MSRRFVNIATISEEDILGEEIGEDGTVETVSLDRLSRESLESEIDVNGWTVRKKEDREEEESQRRHSVVENENSDNTEVSYSILSAISSIEGTLPRQRTPKNSSSSSPKSSRESLRSPSPGRPRTPLPSGTSASSGHLKRHFSWRTGARSPGSTLNLSGKFVTELTFYNPTLGPEKNGCINLGLFIATDQTMGDHFVYKISPMSPFAALKIQQQDRLLKVNDISVSGWSHNCLLEFIRNITLAPSDSDPKADSPCEIPLSMEFRKSGKVIRSIEESPSSKRVAAIVRINKKRVAVLSVHESLVRVRNSFCYCARIKLNSEASLCLHTSMASNNTISLSVVELANLSDNEGYFRLHQFDVSPPCLEAGEVVVIETPNGDGYLHASSQDTIGIMHGQTASPSTFLQIDVRFFQLVSVTGSPFLRIKNLHTGQYLSASRDKIALVNAGNDTSIPRYTLFEIIRAES